MARNSATTAVIAVSGHATRSMNVRTACSTAWLSVRT
jgi:hypothetical protein